MSASRVARRVCNRSRDVRSGVGTVTTRWHLAARGSGFGSGPSAKENR